MNKREVISIIEVPPELQHLLNVRQSKKAKRLIFKASTIKGVEIIFPREFSKGWARDNIKDRKEILLNQLLEISEERILVKPSQINLRAIGETWDVTYSAHQRSQVLESDRYKLCLSTQDNEIDILQIPDALQSWLRGKAVKELTEMTNITASHLKVTFQAVRIKNQKTIWGSCSRQNNINLNQKLLFLPPELASYVVHHELIHLRVFDHSERFWIELGKYIENPKRFRSVLFRKAEKLVPLWAGL